MKLSIIIPAYNASSTITRCLNSILLLPFDANEFEIIVIDDCSKDNTVEIASQFASKHTNITILRQSENHRQGAARNRGLEVAKGEYIFFCDSDDEVTTEIVEALKLALDNNLDICYCDVLAQKPSGDFELMQFDIPTPLLTTGHEMGEKYTDEICTGPWTYIWKTDFLHMVNYPFVEGLRYEDADYVDVHMVNANRVGHYDLCIYKYYYNNQSTVNSCKFDTIADHVLCAYRRFIFNAKIRETNPMFASKRDFQCQCWVKAAFSFRRLTRIDSNDIQKFFERVGDKPLQYFKTISGWNKFNLFCFYHPRLAEILLKMVQPVALITRSVVQKMRSLCLSLSLYRPTTPRTRLFVA